MIPGYIRVFPGLRMSTTHVEHLQAALKTGVEELRAVLRPPGVVDGMAVTLADAGTAQVSPGLAFDGRGRRIALTETRSVELSGLLDLIPAATPPVLYARHAEAEAGEIEGVATLVFDDCELGVAAEVPEDAVALAYLGEADGAPVLLDPEPKGDTGTDAPPQAEPAPEAGPPDPVPPPVAHGSAEREAEPRAISPGAAPQPLDEVPLPLPWPGAALTLHVSLEVFKEDGPALDLAAIAEATVTEGGTLTQFASSDWRLPEASQGRSLRDDVLAEAPVPGLPGASLRLVAVLPGPVARLRAVRDAEAEAEADPDAAPPTLGWRLKLRWRALPLGPEPPDPVPEDGP